MRIYTRFIQITLLLLSFNVLAVPVLQLGPDPDDGGATYDVTTDTWVFSQSTTGFSFFAYNLGDEGLTAYLAFSVMPKSMSDLFDIAVSDDGGALTIFEEGFGAPPFDDPNGLAPHGIFDTWTEVYHLDFNGPKITVIDIQPPEPGDTAGSADGYTELITVEINSWGPALTGIHVDMFTVNSSNQITDFSPFSHDGEVSISVPEPSMLSPALVLLGLTVMVGVRRKHRR